VAAAIALRLLILHADVPLIALPSGGTGPIRAGYSR
jgi:hypothetical protein